jgi:S1-C subfamily serine protease
LRFNLCPLQVGFTLSATFDTLHIHKTAEGTMKRIAFVSGILTASLLTVALVSAQAYAQTDKRGLNTQASGANTQAIGELPSKAKRWALIIGVDEYKDKQIGRLGGAANDARTLADALVRYAGFPPDQVILLATDQPEERQPTRVNIFRRLSNLKSVVPKDGLLLVSFSGHGIEREVGTDKRAYLLPSDAQISDDISFLEDTAVSVERVRERIRATGVQQVIILLDACRNDPASGRADAPNPLTEAYTRGLNFDVRNREVVAFATIYATAVGQRAYEYGEKKQGYFTWAVVEALKGGAANERGEVTLAGLVNFVQAQVPRRIGIDMGIGRQQRPFAVVEGYRAEDLIIAVGTPSTLAAASPSTGPAPNAPMSVAAIAKANRGAVVQINVAWSLVSPTGGPVYQRYLTSLPKGIAGPTLMDTRAGIPCWVEVDSATHTLEPYLTYGEEANRFAKSVPINGIHSGTGFVVSSDGFILTTRHIAAAWKTDYVFPAESNFGVVFDKNKKDLIGIITRAPTDWVPANTRQALRGGLDGRNDRLEVAFSGNENHIAAQVLQVSRRNDVALLKINVPEPTPKVELNDDYDSIQAGDAVTVLGYPTASPPRYSLVRPQGLNRETQFVEIPESTLSTGNIGRILRGSDDPKDDQSSHNDDQGSYIELGDIYQLTLSSTGPGYSGGPVFDDHGRVVGIFFARGYQGNVLLTYAVPIRYGKELLSVTAPKK